RRRHRRDAYAHPGRLDHGLIVEELMVPAQRPAAPHRHQPRCVEGIDHEDHDRQIQEPEPERQRGDVEAGQPGLSHQCASSCRRCSGSYRRSGTTRTRSSTMALAEATGQSLFMKNSSHKVWPIISESDPASRSGMTNSPTMGMKQSSTPAPTPGSDSGNVTSQNTLSGGVPRSAAAPSRSRSIFENVA